MLRVFDAVESGAGLLVEFVVRGDARVALALQRKLVFPRLGCGRIHVFERGLAATEDRGQLVQVMHAPLHCLFHPLDPRIEFGVILARLLYLLDELVDGGDILVLVAGDLQLINAELIDAIFQPCAHGVHRAIGLHLVHPVGNRGQRTRNTLRLS